MVAMAMPAYMPLPSSPPAQSTDTIAAPGTQTGDNTYFRQHAVVGGTFIFLTFFAGPLLDWLTNRGLMGSTVGLHSGMNIAVATSVPRDMHKATPAASYEAMPHTVEHALATYVRCVSCTRRDFGRCGTWLTTTCFTCYAWRQRWRRARWQWCHDCGANRVW